MLLGCRIVFIVIRKQKINKEVSLHHKLPSPRKGDSIRGVIGTIAVFVLAPIVALILVAFVFQSYRVDGPSMEKTLYNNDRLIVNKLPKTWARISNSDYVPSRGAIIVFTKTETLGLDSYGERQLIKRVIGMPGERVVVKDGAITIFNDQNPDGYNPDEGTSYQDSFEISEGNVDITVGEGEVFVMGDNRDNSLDSRLFGPVKSKDIVGELVLRVYPFGKLHSF